MQRNIFEGSEFLLFDIDQNPIAYCKNSAIKINRNLSDVTTKDSEGWNDFINGIKSWSLDFEGLVSYDDARFSTSYFLSKFKHSEPFFISFGIIQDDFTHTFWGEVAIESIEINSDNGEIVSYSGSLKGVGKLAFTNEGTPEQSGYIKTETDPYFRSSPAHSITNSNINNWYDAYNKTLNEVLFNTNGNTTTLNVKLRDGSIYSTSFNHIGGGNGGTILTGLTFNTTTGQLSVNNLSTSLEGRYQPLGSYVSQGYLNDNYYSNSQADSRFATYHYVDTELANLVNSAPSTLDTLNELADALGNDPNFATTITSLIGTKASTDDVYSKLVSDGKYQPLENQRLSSANNVVFNQITANSKLNIPSTSTNRYSIFVDENGVGGTGSNIPVISYLNDLSDVTITSPINGNVLMYNGYEWINSTVTSGTFNYNDLINKPDLSIYALTNGSNAGGNWGINVTGNAAQWAGFNYAGGLGSNSLDWFFAYSNSSSQAHLVTKVEAKASLNISDGSTLYNNISGTAQYATNWGGRQADLNSFITNPSLIPMVDSSDGLIKLATASTLKSWLSLPANSGHLHTDIGFAGAGTDANTVATNTSSFTYALNAPNNGYLGYFGNGGYGLQLNSDYTVGDRLAFRTRNGDAGIFNSWRDILWNGYTFTARFAGGFGTSYTNANIELFREGATPPNLGFHWGNVVASNISIEASGRIAILNNPGTAYEDLVAGTIVGRRIATYGYDSGVAGSINTNDYLRVAGTGGVHWASYGSSLEVVDGNTIGFRSAGAGTSAIGVFTNDSVARGYLYGDNANNIGILHHGGGWSIRSSAGRSIYLNETEGNTNIGTSTGSEKLNIAGWVGSQGNVGWYNSTHGGGIYMEDSTYVRVYNNKEFYSSNWICSQVGFYGHDHGAGLVGSYSGTRYQSVFAMGQPYKMLNDGTGLAIHYGIAWTYEGMEQAKTGLGHQMLITEAGVTQTALGNGIWTRANIYAAGTIEAPTIKANNSMQIPAKNSAGTPTGNHFSIWVEV